jgi:hypothetical protein
VTLHPPYSIPCVTLQRHLQYPQCLGVLELLQRPSFREALKNAQFVDYLKGQQYLQWLYRASSEGM